MRVGFDYWQVISHYPDNIGHIMLAMLRMGDELHVISAIGKGRIGTIKGEVDAALNDRFAGTEYTVHEVVFDGPSQSPELKLAKCKELGITVFFDDRDDICRLLNKNGIMAMRVTRKDNSTYDLEGERK